MQFLIPAEDLAHVLALTRALWDDLRGQRLFITGGTGFFGTWLVETFLWANETLHLDASATVLSRDPQAFLRKMPHLAERTDLQLIPGDVRDFAFPTGRFSHIIHAATPSTGIVTVADRLAVVDTIVRGTRHTLDFARYAGAEAFLLVSSGAVYGHQPPEMSHLSEDYAGAPDPMQPGSAYGEAKRLAEHLGALTSHDGGLEAKIARCFAFVGPWLPLDAHFAVGNFLRDGLRGGPIRVAGDGTPYRSYLYAADLAVWLWTILLRGRSCRPYNVGSESAVRIADLARLTAEAFEPRPNVEIAQAAVPGQPAQRYVPSCRRACEELGLRQQIDLADAIRRTIRWHRARRDN